MGATINGATTVERLVARKARIEDALTRADGERKAGLEAELAGIVEQLATFKAALEAAGV